MKKMMQRSVFLLITLLSIVFGSTLKTKLRDAEPSPSDLIILRQPEVYAPQYLGRKDILMAGGSIIGIVDQMTQSELDTLLSIGIRVNVYNVSDMKAVPGFIDVHVHLTGGGGELGPQSRTPEAQLSELISAGVTTMVGVLGTDSISRSLENLLAKTKAINNDGLTAFMNTGAYRVPVPVLTDNLMNDLVVISEVIGVGEVAISDYRSSAPTLEELSRIASDCKVASLLTGKGGLVHVHVGKESSRLTPLWDVIQKTSVSITQFHPTHLSGRSAELLEDAKNWLRSGGYGDFTAEDTVEDNSAIQALLQFKSENIPLDKLTLSSDAYGSFPVFDELGNVIRYGVGKADTLLFTVKELVNRHGWSLESALAHVTVNVATIYNFTKKGRLQVGMDGDLLLLDKNLNIAYVFAKGKEMKTPSWIKKGMFES